MRPGKSREEKLKHLDAALEYVTNFRLAIDVGAHQGLWTEVMAKRFKRVLAFEPFAGNYPEWHKRLVGHDNVLLIKAAVGDELTKCRLVGEKHSLHYCVKDPAGDISMVALDPFAYNDLDFLKVDAEGADTLVLKGAEQTIRRCRPVVCVEWHPKFDKRYDLPPQAAIKFLEGLGAKQVAAMRHDYIFSFDGPV